MSVRHDYLLANPSAYLAWAEKFRATHLMRSYGLTEEQYWDIWYRQGGACAICGSGQPGGNGAAHLHVDHCHETGRVRGLLCYACNVSLGKMQESANLLRIAADYLEGLVAW